MHITITIDGVTREYKGDPDELHNNDWEQIIRDFIDDRKTT